MRNFNAKEGSAGQALALYQVNSGGPTKAEFKAELGYLKRYPKKDTDKKSHNPIRCIKIPLSFFPREEEDVEILDRKDKDQIL